MPITCQSSVDQVLLIKMSIKALIEGVNRHSTMKIYVLNTHDPTGLTVELIRLTLEKLRDFAF